MVRLAPAISVAAFLFIGGCSGSNVEELNKARADADAARTEAVKARAEADAAKAELTKLGAAQAETAAKPVPQPDTGQDPHSLRVQSPEQIKVNGFEVEINGAVDPNVGVKQVMWHWGDGTPENNSHFPAKHAYAKPGTYEVQVTSYDDAGKTSTRITKVTVPRAP